MQRGFSADDRSLDVRRWVKAKGHVALPAGCIGAVLEAVIAVVIVAGGGKEVGGDLCD